MKKAQRESAYRLSGIKSEINLRAKSAKSQEAESDVDKVPTNRNESDLDEAELDFSQVKQKLNYGKHGTVVDLGIYGTSLKTLNISDDIAEPALVSHKKNYPVS